MERYDEERSELTGGLISIEFGPGGRVTQLWASDPALPDEGEEFQFVLPPVAFGEENSDDYLPGTILIGARSHAFSLAISWSAGPCGPALIQQTRCRSTR